MQKKTLSDITIQGKRILMRVDFNVPLNDEREITDDKRIVEALPSIRKILDNGGRLILMSHLGRPKGKVNPLFSLAPVAAKLSELIDTPVAMAEDCIGTEVMQAALALQDGEVMLLETYGSTPRRKPTTLNSQKSSPRLAKSMSTTHSVRHTGPMPQLKESPTSYKRLLPDT